MADFNEYFTHMIIEMQKEAFDNPAKADMLNKLITDLWVCKASLRIIEEKEVHSHESF